MFSQLPTPALHVTSGALMRGARRSLWILGMVLAVNGIAAQPIEAHRCRELLAKATALEDLVHLRIRQIIHGSQDHSAQLLQLFLFLQTRPKLTDRDFYYLIDRMPRGVNLVLAAGQKELIQRVIATTPPFMRTPQIDPLSPQPIDLNLLFLAIHCVKEISRPDLWRLSYGPLLEFFKTSVNWSVHPTTYQAGVMGVFFARIDQP